jgi:hypothetical protein
MVDDKDTPPKDLSFSSSKIQEALEVSADTFKERSSSYDEISQDYKNAEAFLRNTGLKELFSYDFNRIRGGVLPPDFWLHGSIDADYDNYHELEALEWRFENKSKKFRLMVSRYLLKRIPEIEYEKGSYEKPYNGPLYYETVKNLDSPESDRIYYIEEACPIIESPIEIRIFYHSRLPEFIKTFAETLQEIKDNEAGYFPVIHDISDHSCHQHISAAITVTKGKQTIKLFGGNSYRTNPGIQKRGPKGEDIPI